MADQLVYHYLTLGRLGRGEVVNLFLKDAGFEFDDVRYAYDDTWPETSKKLKQEGLTRTGLLPVIEHKGEKLTQHLPILRYFAREIGGYDGETNWEKYIVDAVADIYIDWRAQWVANLKGGNAEYKNKVVPDYYNLVGQYYSEREGPYLLGDKVTYVDFAVFQSIDNDRRTGTLPESLPESLVKFEKAFETRPKIAEYIKEHK
ncbi:glutathione S-transferase [Aspergillus pseudodeflectus]|uniref:Glutathione S-transferase n=1 Tax=Aspergillus pseudodeflectus TaxID=176178 RepID=A0ABR4JHM3_9EURO